MPAESQPEQVRKFNPLTRFLGGFTAFIWTGFVSTLRVAFGGTAYVMAGIGNMARNATGFVIGGLMAVGAEGINLLRKGAGLILGAIVEILNLFALKPFALLVGLAGVFFRGLFPGGTEAWEFGKYLYNLISFPIGNPFLGVYKAVAGTDLLYSVSHDNALGSKFSKTFEAINRSKLFGEKDWMYGQHVADDAYYFFSQSNSKTALPYDIVGQVVSDFNASRNAAEIAFSVSAQFTAGVVAAGPVGISYLLFGLGRGLYVAEGWGFGRGLVASVWNTLTFPWRVTSRNGGSFKRFITILGADIDNLWKNKIELWDVTDHRLVPEEKKVSRARDSDKDVRYSHSDAQIRGVSPSDNRQEARKSPSRAASPEPLRTSSSSVAAKALEPARSRSRSVEPLQVIDYRPPRSVDLPSAASRRSEAALVGSKPGIRNAGSQNGSSSAVKSSPGRTSNRDGVNRNSFHKPKPKPKPKPQGQREKNARPSSPHESKPG